MSDIYEKVPSNGGYGLDRPEYVLKNGRAINCYGLLKDVHVFQSDLVATQEHLRLKGLECQQLAGDKAELVDMVRYLTICADDHPAKPATAKAHELLERLK